MSLCVARNLRLEDSGESHASRRQEAASQLPWHAGTAARVGRGERKGMHEARTGMQDSNSRKSNSCKGAFS